MAKTKYKEILQSDDPMKDKLAYLWDYHKWHLLIVLAVVSTIIFLINETADQPEAHFHMSVLGDEGEISEEQELEDELRELFGVDGEEADVYVYFSLMGRLTERFQAHSSAGEYDLIVMSQEAFEQFGSTGGMHTLRVDQSDDPDDYYLDQNGNPVGIAAEELAIFADYSTLEDMVITIPRNAGRTDRTIELFESQGLELELVTPES